MQRFVREYAEYRRHTLMNAPVVNAVTHFKKLDRIDKIVLQYERKYITADEAVSLLGRI